MRSALAGGSTVELRPLEPGDVTSAYLGWMNDPLVTRHLESRGPFDLDDLRSWVEEQSARTDVVLCGIVRLEDGRHIGNIKLGPVRSGNASASIGVLIGDRGCWGRGHATEAIQLLAEHAFSVMGLAELTAGAHEDNAASVRAFQRAGFEASFDSGRRQWRMVRRRSQEPIPTLG